MAQQAEWNALPESERPRSSPVIQHAAREYLEQMRLQFEQSGLGFDILAAVRRCAAADIPMPDWLAKAYCERYDRVLNLRAASWDEAFDKPYAKGKQVNRIQADRRDRFKVYLAVKQELNSEPRPAIDEQLFERIGQQVGTGKTRANRLYYEALAMFPDPADE